jgi:hypothetical protein
MAIDHRDTGNTVNDTVLERLSWGRRAVSQSFSVPSVSLWFDAVRRANGNLTLTRLQRVGPSPGRAERGTVERGEQQQFPTARESPFASPLPEREGWPREAGTG